MKAYELTGTEAKEITGTRETKPADIAAVILMSAFAAFLILEIARILF